MQRRAGHETVTTPVGYVKMAEDADDPTGKVGAPFGPLPACLVEPEPTGEILEAAAE